MKAILRFLWDLVYFLSGEGTWRLRTHETIALDAAITALPVDIQGQLRQHLTQKVFVYRVGQRISRPRFSAPPIEASELRHVLLKVEIDVEGKKETAHVEFYRGRADSIQFKHPAKFYAGKTVKALAVRPGNPSLSHAAALDRLEHGSHP